MKKILFIVMCLSVPFFTVSAQKLAGTWSGKLNLGLQELGLEFAITGQPGQDMQVKLSVPEQGVQGIPVKVLPAEGDSLKLTIENLGLYYEGQLQGDSILGMFSQGGQILDLTLHRGGLQLVRPQTPKAPFAYETQEITFENKLHALPLHGTLTLPVGYKKGDHPNVVLMVTGSGVQDRDEQLMGHRPFAVIADALAQRGIASLRYDDRGYGMSAQELKDQTITTELNAEDAAAGLEWLRSQKLFAHVGVLGHSEGGTIAFMLGDKADFIVSMAGAALPGDSILLDQNRDLLSLMGGKQVAEDYCTVLREVLLYKKTRQGGANSTFITPAMIVSSMALKHGMKLSDELSANLVSVLKDDDPWLMHFINLNPADCLGKVKCPVLAIGGNKDLQVNTEKNLEVIRKMLPADCKREVKVYDGLNHLFQHCSYGLPQEYGSLQETISQEVLIDIAQFINQLF